MPYTYRVLTTAVNNLRFHNIVSTTMFFRYNDCWREPLWMRHWISGFHKLVFANIIQFWMLLISRSMDLWKICISSLCSTDKLSFLSFQSSASSQYLLLFLKSSRSCVLLLPTTFTSNICPSMASWRIINFFSEYDQFNWLFYVRYYLEMSSSLLYVQELVLVLVN